MKDYPKAAMKLLNENFEFCTSRVLGAQEAEDGTTKLKYGECANRSKKEIRAAMESRVKTFCAQDLVASDESNTISGMSAFNLNVMNQVIKDIFDELQIGFSVGCEELDATDVKNRVAKGDFETEEKPYARKGIWYDADSITTPDVNLLYAPFYKKYYGMATLSVDTISRLSLEDKGWCLDSDKIKGKGALEDICSSFAGDVNGDMCSLDDSFYELRCCEMGGIWQNNTCRFENWPQKTGSLDCGTQQKRFETVKAQKQSAVDKISYQQESFGQEYYVQ